MLTKVRNLTDNFYSFEEFCLLPDTSFKGDENREWGVQMHGTEWVIRYQLAKEQWEKYKVIPVGSKVNVIVNGHGTTFPTIRSVSEARDYSIQTVFKEDDIWYYVERIDDPYWTNHALPARKSISLLDKKLWWRSVILKT